MLSLMLRPIIFLFAASYFSYSACSLPNSFTSCWPLTDKVSFRIPLISSLHSCDSRVRSHLVFPARRVGITKRGMISTPTVARIQFSRYMTTTATVSVMTLERMLVIVFVIVRCTPSISLVMRVMMSPWLLVVKKRCDIFCRCLYILFRMSNVMCCAIHVLR